MLRNHILNQVPFSRIIPIDPVALSPWGSPFFEHVRANEAAFVRVPDYIHEAMVRAYINTASVCPLDEESLAATVSPWTTVDGKDAFNRQIAQASSRFTDEVQRLYSTISAPVLLLWGREVRWIPLERRKRLHDLIPGSRFRITEDAGHLVIEEKPEKLVAAIVEFLNSGKLGSADAEPDQYRL